MHKRRRSALVAVLVFVSMATACSSIEPESSNPFPAGSVASTESTASAGVDVQGSAVALPPGNDSPSGEYRLIRDDDRDVGEVYRVQTGELIVETAYPNVIGELSIVWAPDSSAVLVNGDGLWTLLRIEGGSVSQPVFASGGGALDPVFSSGDGFVAAAAFTLVDLFQNRPMFVDDDGVGGIGSDSEIPDSVATNARRTLLPYWQLVGSDDTPIGILLNSDGVLLRLLPNGDLLPMPDGPERAERGSRESVVCGGRVGVPTGTDGAVWFFDSVNDSWGHIEIERATPLECSLTGSRLRIETSKGSITCDLSVEDGNCRVV